MERHSTDMVSLVFGLLFTAIAVIGLTDLVELSHADVRWIAPALVVALGVLLVLTAGRGRNRDETAPDVDSFETAPDLDSTEEELPGRDEPEAR